MRSIIPWILRLGLGLYWLFVGLVPKILLAPGPSDRSVLGSFHLSWLAQPPVWLALGVLEVLLGLALLAGVRVRELAGLQSLLLLAGSLWAIVLDPFAFTYPLGGSSGNFLLIAFGLGLVVTGGGEWLCWDRRLDRRRPERALQRAERAERWIAACAARFYRTQAEGLTDVEVSGMLLRYSGEEEAVAAGSRNRGSGLGGVLGWLTAKSGTRAALRTNLELEQRRADQARRRLELAARLGAAASRRSAEATWRRADERTASFESRLTDLGEGLPAEPDRGEPA
ncbi:MAG: DoxX-like family protein [Planctomycetota bacterium]